MNTEEIVEVFRRWMNGETREYLSIDGNWYPVMDHDYNWNAATDYRIAPKPREPREWWLHQESQVGPIVVSPYDCNVPGCVRIHVREVIEP